MEVKDRSIRCWDTIITLCSTRTVCHRIPYTQPWWNFLAAFPGTPAASLAYWEWRSEPERAGSWLRYYSQCSFLIRHPGSSYSYCIWDFFSISVEFPMVFRTWYREYLKISPLSRYSWTKLLTYFSNDDKERAKRCVRRCCQLSSNCWRKRK